MGSGWAGAKGIHGSQKLASGGIEEVTREEETLFLERRLG